MTPTFAGQLINLLAALLLLIAFAMLSQRRVLSLIYLFAWQGFVLVLSTTLVAYSTGQHHLYYSAALTLILKVFALPWILHRLIIRLNIKWDVETLINIPTTMLLGIAMACVLLAFLMMITRRKAVPQVIGFLAIENGLFFAATSATYGMPMVVEFGVALDVLVGTFIFGIFFFQIRETFDSLDIHHLEKLKED